MSSQPRLFELLVPLRQQTDGSKAEHTYSTWGLLYDKLLELTEDGLHLQDVTRMHIDDGIGPMLHPCRLISIFLKEYSQYEQLHEEILPYVREAFKLHGTYCCENHSRTPRYFA